GRADHAPRFGAARAKHRRRGPFLGNRFPHAGIGQLRIAVKIMERPDDLLDVIAVVKHKPVTEVVDAVPELVSAGTQIKIHLLWIETDIATSGREQSLVFPFNLAPDEARHKINLVLQAPFQAVSEPLHVAVVEAGQNYVADVRHAVAV